LNANSLRHTSFHYDIVRHTARRKRKVKKMQHTDTGETQAHKTSRHEHNQTDSHLNRDGSTWGNGEGLVGCFLRNRGRRPSLEDTKCETANQCQTKYEKANKFLEDFGVTMELKNLQSSMFTYSNPISFNPLATIASPIAMILIIK
jgi:hypothetical protein